MIYIFGDSWGYSFTIRTTKDGTKYDSYEGATLADVLSEKISISVINQCDRGYSNFRVADKLKLFADDGKFNKDDLVIVLQTDPLRSIFVPWDRWPDYLDNYPLELKTSTNMMELCDRHLLPDYYNRLKNIQDQCGIKILLHGGCSQLNHDLAKQIGLLYTEKTSTQAIAPESEDSYFFGIPYILQGHDVLKAKFENYNDDAVCMMSIYTAVKKKWAIWSQYSNIFTNAHYTIEGTELVAEYLADFLQQNHLI
jgi:hypothetical protein